MTGSDIVGLIGVALVVGTYFLAQIERMAVNEPLYPAVNAIGAVLILISLSHTFNLASVVIELVWLTISAVGFARALLLRRTKRNSRQDGGEP